MPLASSYGALMALRVSAALAAAVVLPTVFAVTAALAPPGRQGRDLATVMAGLTGAVVAVVAVVPSGTWIGAAFGWRATFVAGGLLGVATLIFLRAAVPDVPSPSPSPPAAGAAKRLRPDLLFVLLAAVVAVLGNLLFQTYLGPFPSDAADVGAARLGGLLLLAGVAGIAGARFSGTLVDRIGPARTFAFAITAFTAAMASLALFWTVRPVHVALVVVPLVLWSAAAWAVPPPVQARALAFAGDETGPQPLALVSSSVYLGAALGAGLGGWLLGTFGPGTLPVAATLCALAALAGRAVPAPSAQQRETHTRKAQV